ncbi:unnamed protein product, partial [marine sediment metagenome]
RTLTAYSGITTSDGAGDGTTLVDSNLIGRNNFITEKTILIMSGTAKDEDKGAIDFDNTDGKITLQGTGFRTEIKAGTIFRVLNISSVEMDVARIEAKIDALSGATGIFHEQADVALSFNTVSGSETNVFNLVVADTRYIIRSLRLKFADPGGETITVRLYELVNDGLIEVDSFEVTTANFGTYHSLMDMFGMAQLAGDNLKVTTRVSAGADIATLGQYSWAKTNV